MTAAELSHVYMTEHMFARQLSTGVAVIINVLLTYEIMQHQSRYQPLHLALWVPELVI